MIHIILRVKIFVKKVLMILIMHLIFLKKIRDSNITLEKTIKNQNEHISDLHEKKNYEF